MPTYSNSPSADFDRSPIRRARPRQSIDEDEVTRKPNPYKDVPALYDLYSQVSKRSAKQRFGQDVFENQDGTFDDLPLDLPVGDDYVVGPGDGLQIEIWGAVSRRLKRNVDREGKLALPEVGTISVSGRTLGEVQQQVQQVLRTNFRDVSADVSLGKLKSVRVYVVGDVNYPGAYDVSSLSTPLTAVLEAGGPSSRGSIRTFKHFRGKQLVQVVDVYDLLLHGVGGNLRRLEPGDTILVPPLERQVTIEGMVRRPALYEIRDEKSLADVLALAGGVLPSATLRNIEVERIVKHEKRTMLSFRVPDSEDANSVDRALSEFQIQPGDTIRISSIGPYRDKTVYLDGHVYRPGKYSYRDGMKVQDLVQDYSQLLPEPYAVHAEVIRLAAPDYRPTVLAFNLQDALARKDNANLTLLPYDTVRIFSRYDFEDAPTVTVSGEVRAPGRHQTNGQMRVRDAIYLAGGLTRNASLESVQIYRKAPGAMLKVIDVDLRSALSGNDGQNLVLESQDRIVVHRNNAEMDPAAVFVGGEVVNPGKYPLAEGMTATQLVRLAGGLKRGAYAQAADLTNYVKGEASGELITVDLTRAMSDRSADRVLKDGDTLTVRQVEGWKNLGASVAVRGEVAHPSTYGIREGERLSSVLKRAGGFTQQGYPEGIVLERREVRDIEQANREELIRRLEEEQRTFQTSPGINIAQPGDQAVLRQAFLQQQSAILMRLKNAPTVGRVVIKISNHSSKWENTPSDVELRAGDVITIPKRPDYIIVSGQVYNPTAFAYRPGRNAGWYLQQAGGVNELGNKGAIFVVRADGSVVGGGGGGGGWWKEDAVDVVIRPGDTVVVPEKLLQIKGTAMKTLAETAQIVSSIAIAASVALQ
jgi:polysaccharide biosynthesis/export protein